MLIAPAAALAIFWLWFLARGKSAGRTKRLGLRATILAVIGGLVAAGTYKGIFLRATLGFRLALLLALLAVAVGYLYLIRFCDGCGRMERNIKTARCRRCGAWLPINGMSEKLRRAGDDLRWDQRPGRSRTDRRPKGS